MGIIRKTQSVERLLNEFEKSSEAISAKELIERLNSKMNKTTIYRVLDRLEDDGILHSFLGINGIKWYAKCNNCTKVAHTDKHPHFQCINCGKVDCLPFHVNIPKIPNREILFSQILIQGKCEVCSN
ncbi:transcriptional regulator [Tenacibaculum holothuriorum]|uniref:Transcriptional regulator n=1 Tax=Tenacibaculum holothuriorum TaxID=1635173 RepID=A0A1Y2PGZ8_9FLAO|nr:transcriptional repressor [Tenacibaculum holothuriorum]OSY89271.1 transcriptional regulator [Tenacibaculum holothuriorum]